MKTLNHHKSSSNGLCISQIVFNIHILVVSTHHKSTMKSIFHPMTNPLEIRKKRKNTKTVQHHKSICSIQHIKSPKNPPLPREPSVTAGDALQYASARRRQDRHIVLKAVSRQGRALQAAALQLRDDKENPGGKPWGKPWGKSP